MEYGTFLFYFPDRIVPEITENSSDDEGEEYELDAEENKYIEVKLPEKDKINWINQTSSFDTKSSKTRKFRQNVKRIITRRNRV